MQSSMKRDLSTIGLITLGLIVWVLGCRMPNRNTSPASSPTTVRPAPTGDQPSKASNWFYQEEPDKMGRGTIKRAWTMSLNSVSFDFPYAGEQHARLALRSHPQHGKDVMIGIEKGQFLCRFDGCSVLVRFDDGKPTPYSAAEPSDHTATMLFIDGFDKFVAAAKRSKKVMIEAEFYREGSRVFEFAVEGLEWETNKQAK